MSAVVDTLLNLLESDPRNWQHRLAAVEALSNEGRIDEASALLHGIEHLPEDLHDRAVAGRAYGLVNPPAGFEVLEGIIAEAPTFAPAHLEKAELHARIGETEKGRQHYYTGATLDPQFANPALEERLGIVESLIPTEGAEPAPPDLQEVEAEPVEQLKPIPVVPLRTALDQRRLQPIVDPDSVPAHPSLAYNSEPAYQQPAYVPEQVFLQNVHPVELHPANRPEPVVYDYRAPDESLFDPAISDEDIFVRATHDEYGERYDDGLGAVLKENRKARAEEISESTKRDKRHAFVVANLAIFAILGAMMLVVTSLPPPTPPQIIASAPLPNQQKELENQHLRRPELQKTPTMSSPSAMAVDAVSATTYSDVAITNFETPSLSPGLGMTGNDFGMSMNFGNDVGGPTAMFFGGKSTGKRYLFVLDNSISMEPHQIELRNSELEKTLKSLRGVQYHVMLFAGGLYFVDDGWKLKKEQPDDQPTRFESPDGDYEFKMSSLFDFKLVGDEDEFPAPEWLSATTSNIRRSIRSVKAAKQFGGTDWDTALQMAHLMDPPPDVIFFMSDGQDREMSPSQIVRHSKKHGGPQINCVAMQTIDGVKEFSEIAKRTKGVYTIVDKDGEPIDGFDYQKNPKDFEGRL